MSRLWLLPLLLLCCVAKAAAQEFVNLTAPEVRVDSVLPVCYHEFPLGQDYSGNYTVSIDYPEFIDMSPADIERLRAITTDTLPPVPAVDTYIGVSRRQGTLYASFVPIVMRDGKYQKLVSYRLSLNRANRANGANKPNRANKTNEPHPAYATHSVLATGSWAKISVPSTGVYQLTEQLVRQAGFSSLSRVKVYGYGGALQPEVLDADYLQATDDLKEVATCTIGGRRLLHATGPVTWSSATATERTRNPYSDVGCYFLTESDDEPLSVDSATFVSAFYPAADDYHSLHEVDDYAWYHSGRNLYESTPIPTETAATYSLDAHTDSGLLTVVLTGNGAGSVSIMLGDSLIGTMSLTGTLPSQSKAMQRTQTFSINGLLQRHNTIRLQQTAGDATLRLDYMLLTMPTPAPAPSLSSGTFATPRLEYRITTQDHHADAAADMVIIIPTTQRFRNQAERLKTLHEERDSLRVTIVPADELYNEFSSGTPDANAYRRYMKMLYDRAETEADMPRYLLLMGDGAWDNRMLSSDWRQTSPDDFLLCYESDNSFSETMSYVSDDYYAMLDDGEGGSLTKRDRADIGVGRLTARTEADATILVDKIVDYATNAHAGDWQNTLCFMGDDGNGNVHMREAEAAAQTVMAEHQAFNIKKVYWDAYERQSTTVGNRYPDAERLIKQQMQQGALIMDYCGHGAPYTISHERVINISDFAAQTSLRLPLWVTASCDIMPFDTQEENIGETAMLNNRGGAIAFFGTTRTVYTGDNQNMNCAFLKYALGYTDGRKNTLGDAVRLSKNDVRSIGENPTDKRTESYPVNKLHYSLLGDPALRLALPTAGIVVDSINGQPVSATEPVKLTAGQKATVTGHISTLNSQLSTPSPARCR